MGLHGLNPMSWGKIKTPASVQTYRGGVSKCLAADLAISSAILHNCNTKIQHNVV